MRPSNNSRCGARWQFRVALCALALFCFPQALLAERIIIRNVTLLDPAAPDKSRSVSLLVDSDRLEYLTEDTIPDEEADTIYDGARGTLFGDLGLKERANFLVLDGDPRSNIDVLMDTRRYTLFSIKNGSIRRNRLKKIDTRQAGASDEADWLAYSPPPLAVPLDYYNRDKWNRFDIGPVSGIFAAAVLLDRARWLKQDSVSRAQVGDLDAFSGGSIRALRLGGTGTINLDRPLVWTVFGATHAFDRGFDVRDSDEFTIFDLRLDIPVNDQTTLSLGKQKPPISMERIMANAFLPMQERSAVSDALLPARDTGVVLSSSFWGGDATVAAGVFNNWLDKDQPNSPSDNATVFNGRISGLPFESDDGSTLLHVGGAYRYSTAKEGAIVTSSPEIASAPNFIDTGVVPADDLSTLQGEVSLRSGPIWWHNEYLTAELESPTGDTGRSSGYHSTLSWVLTGETRDYDRNAGIFRRLNVARSVEQGGVGTVEVAVRYSHFETSEAVFGKQNLDIWSAGINWWLTPKLAFHLNYRLAELDNAAGSGWSHGINYRVTMALE